MKAPTPRSFRLSAVALKNLRRLAESTGGNQTAALEVLLRTSAYVTTCCTACGTPANTGNGAGARVTYICGGCVQKRRA